MTLIRFLYFVDKRSIFDTLCLYYTRDAIVTIITLCDYLEIYIGMIIQ